MDPFTSEERMKQMISLDDLVVAEVDGTFAGFAYFFVDNHPWFEPEVERYRHILGVHVKEEYQGLGLATRMLKYTIEDLKNRNVNVIYIDTGGHNARAIRLYEKMGFREFGRTIHFKKIIGRLPFRNNARKGSEESDSDNVGVKACLSERTCRNRRP